MSCAMEKQPTFARCPSPAQGHRRAVVVFGEARLGKLEFQFGEDIRGSQNRVGVFPDVARHLEQDAMNLGLLFIQQADPFVVLLDGLERLYKHGLSAGTRSVYDTLHAPLLLNFHRNYETLAADGDKF